MTKFQIATDSTSDLPADYIRENNLTIMNLAYTIDGKTYGKGEELDVYEFYKMMRNGLLPTTSQVNPDQAREALLKMLEKGNDILYIAFSSGLSGTYNSVSIAATEIMEENKDANIIVIDTKAASLGEGLLVHKAIVMRNEGKTMEETAQWLNDHALNLVHAFTVDDLNHLYRGGRVSKTAAFLGTVLNIKPILHVDNEGHLIPLYKVRGRKKSLTELVDYMEKNMGSYRSQNDIFFISHGDCLEEAEFVRDEVIRRFGIKKCVINHVGPTIGAHSGPGTMALFFLGETR